MASDRLMGTPQLRNASEDTRIYTIWPATQEDLPTTTSGPWCQEHHWLVLDVTDGIAASYIVEGPVTHSEALRRAAEIRIVAGTEGRPRGLTPGNGDGAREP